VKNPEYTTLDEEYISPMTKKIIAQLEATQEELAVCKA
jgi:hypothetical protein